MSTAILIALGLVCAAAGIAWFRSARLRWRFLHTIERDDTNSEAFALAEGNFRREAHAGFLYALLSVASLVTAFGGKAENAVIFAVVALPAFVSLFWARSAVFDARLTRQRFDLERRAEEALAQEDLAPKAWAERLAPADLPDFTGFEVGRVYQAGSGLMAGDFFDVFRVDDSRIAALIGDVSGHGIESSITAFQAKYLLRVFLRQFRDPAQALEELNQQLSNIDRNEEFISLVVIVFDTDAGTLRFASAGHPAAWLWHELEVQPLRATGPLVMLDPKSTYFSREIPMAMGDFVLLYTDGLAEARRGDEQYGEDRIAQVMKRDPGIAPDVLCKSLLDAGRDFAGGKIDDDVAILAIRRT